MILVLLLFYFQCQFFICLPAAMQGNDKMCIRHCWDRNQLSCKCRETSMVMCWVLRPYLGSRTNCLTVESILWTREPSDRTQNLHRRLGKRGRKKETASKWQNQCSESKLLKNSYLQYSTVSALLHTHLGVKRLKGRNIRKLRSKETFIRLITRTMRDWWDISLCFCLILTTLKS